MRLQAEQEVRDSPVFPLDFWKLELPWSLVLGIWSLLPPCCCDNRFQEKVVDRIGIKPTTSSLRTTRSIN
jgi:hypothetical protein